MNLKEDSGNVEVSELKQEILNLRKELDKLYEEHNRLQGHFGENIPSTSTAIKKISSLHENGEIYRQIVDSANEGIWISDLDMITIYVNQKMADMLGYTVEEIMGTMVLDFLDDQGKAIARRNRETRIKGEKDTYEQKYIRKDGSLLWALLSASPLMDSSGKVIGILGMLTDITSRRNIETELQKSEKRYRELVQSANSLIIRIDSNGQILFANKFALNFFGYTAEEFISKNINIIIPSQVIHGQNLDNLISNIIHTPGEYLQFENENIRKNGERIWINWSNRVVKDEYGNIQEILAIGNDVTQRRQAEEDALTRATEIEAVLSCIANGVIVYDTQTRVIRSNTAATSYLKLRENEKMLSLADRFNRHYQAWNEDGRELSAEDLPAYRSSVFGETIWNEVILYSIDNEHHWFEISASPLIISGKHSGGVVSMVDITWKKQIEENLRANEAAMEAFFDASPGILNLFDENFRFLNTDKITASYFDLTRDTIKGKYVKDLAPGFLNSFGNKLKNVIDTGEPWTDAEVQFQSLRNLDEETLWQNSYFRVPLPGGKKGLGSIGLDISDIKRAEQELKHERELFESIVNNIPVMITIYDPELRAFRFNKEMQQITGWNESDTAEGNFIEKVYPDPEYRSIVVDFMKSLQPGWKEWTMTAKDGSKIESSWANILLNSGLQIGIGIDMRERKQAEKALLENKQRMEATFNNAAVGIIEVDANEQFSAVNDRICELLNYSREQLLGKKVSDITYHEDLLVSNIVNDKIIQNELNRFSYEKRYVKSNGTPVWVHVTVSGVYDFEGNFLNAIGTVEDITERREFEEAIRSSEEHFRLLADNISQMTWIIDNKGEALWYNKRWFDFTGKSIEEIQKDGYKSVVHPVYFDEVMTILRKSLKSGEAWESSYPMLSKNGEYRWFLTRAIPIHDNKGNLKQWFGTSTDINEQIKIEENLRRNEQRLDAIFNNAAIGIMEMDENNRFLLVNDRVCEILGYARQELLGKTVMDIAKPEDIEITKHLYMLFHEGKINILNYEKQYQKKDNSLLWVHITVSSIRDSQGKHLRSIATVKDISERKFTEKKLQETLSIAEEGKNVLNAMMENIPIGITIAETSDVNIKMISKYGREFLNHTHEEHQTQIDLLYPDGTKPESSNKLPLSRAVLFGEIVKDEEWLIARNDGTLIPFLCNAAPFYDETGKIIGGVMSWQDIAERKRFLEELRYSEEQLRTVIEAADLGTWNFDIESGVAVHSLRHDQIFGYEEAQLDWSYEKSVQHIFPEYHNTVRDAVTRALETGILEYDAKIRWPDGSIRWIGPRGKVLYNSEGKPLRMTGIVSDITQRKVAEEAMKESEEKFRSLFENITEGVALFEVEYKNEKVLRSRLIDVNPALKNFMGLQAYTSLAEIEQALLNESQMKNLKEYVKVAETGEPYKFEVNYQNLNKHFTINVISPKKGQFATVLEDITEQKRIEQELKQRNEELTRFIYTVSHDLKSPLVTIKSFTSFLKSDIEIDDKASQEKDIHYIQNAADKMGTLLDELLELSRIGRKESPKKEVTMHHVAKSALDLVAGRIAQKNIRVTFSGPEVLIFGHIQRLIQLYQNLLDNAAKFMGNQPDPLIEIGAYMDENRNNEIVLFVRDNGSGIDPKYHHKLFRLFEKLDNSTEGTGIGLALIKRIIEVHGGSIWFTSEGSGKGTTFYFTLDRSRLKE